eukprot:CAMPEP_0204158822 /NCGR_PEP_ID=MMETSP0361-20130328/32443_1 /ASSEMBLY_ACC=CAM_ASM_000343 /TAXON_ID=268821 /ORGANISM="Scrippsiella Hangoei, Strain SHTV-5" /LENGTH=81 /DNA_ID=CAMNT_0051114821 /DNA_START=27 /DNA_END=269 /DNA_ORIENTATION=+
MSAANTNLWVHSMLSNTWPGTQNSINSILAPPSNLAEPPNMSSRWVSNSRSVSANAPALGSHFLSVNSFSNFVCDPASCGE